VQITRNNVEHGWLRLTFLLGPEICGATCVAEASAFFTSRHGQVELEPKSNKQESSDMTRFHECPRIDFDPAWAVNAQHALGGRSQLLLSLGRTSTLVANELNGLSRRFL